MPTLAGILERGEAGAVALESPGGLRLTYAQLRDEVARAADTLAALGLERSDRVALVLPNGPEAVILFLAATLAATAAPLNPGYTEDEFRFYMDDTEAKAVVVPAGGGAAALAAAPAGAVAIEATLEPEGRLRLDSRGPGARTAGARAAAEPDPGDVALVLHTSGTTSRPKRVPLRHRNLAASVDHIAASYALGPEDVSLCVMPLFHVHGLMASALACLRTGGRLVVPPRFNALGFAPLLQEYGVTWYSAVPTLHRLAIARSRGRDTGGGSGRLRFIRSCSAALSPSLLAELEGQFGVPVLEAYGMTEASHQIASNPLPPGMRVPGSVGMGTGVEIGIMDERGTLLPEQVTGEVVIRGPNVTDGYENNPAANAESFTHGWFRTGDLGAMAPLAPAARAGSPGSPPLHYVNLLGRIKELINRGGEKISPLEVDEVLLQHPAVAEAVCFGMPHEVWGEEVAAAVTLSRPADEAEVIRFCRERLADFKVPRRIFVLETIPRTATGKVQRRHVAAAVLGAEP